jgi:2,3-diketo-5-methylthio-1-phosphopentane phosphatase
LVSDFDGTMTRTDFYQAIAPLVPSDTTDFWQEYVEGRITHFDALAGIFTAAGTDEQALVAAAERMQLEPRLAELCEKLRAADWELVIASAGCAWYIERLLAERGVRIAVVANPGRFDPRRGLEMLRPVWSPYYSEMTGIDKAAVVRSALATARTVAFAGDGRPDVHAALLVDPSLRFARGDLAQILSESDEQYVPFDRWSEVVERLVATG